MNLPMMAAGQGPITMSSREIAELCEKLHKHVLRDIEAMLAQINQPNCGPVDFEAQYQDAKGEWRKEYRLPRDLTVTLITGYRADLRYKVVKRLEELEGRGGFAIPQSLPDALRLAADLADQNTRLTAQVDGMRDDVAALERIAKADGSLSVTEAAKNLGMRPKDLFDWLSRNGWIYRRAGSSFWLGYQPKCNQGLLEHKSTTVLRADGSEKISEQVRITPKGLSALAKAMPQSALPLGGDK